VIVRNGPGKEDGTRVVPVIHRLDDFSAGGGYKLAEVKLSAVPLGRSGADVGLLNVAVGVLVGAGVHDVIGAAEDEIHMHADRIRIVVDGELGHRQVELIGLVVEVVQVVDLSVGGIAWAVGVVAVVAVDQATEVERTDTPY